MKIIPVVAVCALLAAASDAAQAETISDHFSTNPVGTSGIVTAGDASRFSYDAASQSVVANYDSTLPTAKLLFPLGRTINQNEAFSFSTTFTIKSITNFDHTDPRDAASNLGTAQLSFGLVNSATTGNNRTDGFSGDAYDLATVDYFPTNNAFGTPNVGATVVESAEAGHAYFEKIDFPPSANSSMSDFLSSGVPITATVSYDPGTHVVTATFTGNALTLGGATSFTSTQDLDATSLAFDSDGFKGFSLDSFALTLWDDSSAIGAGFDAPVSAQIAFQDFSVTVGTPEPATLSLLSAGALLLMKRRSQRGQR